jgi:hypothetical protein
MWIKICIHEGKISIYTQPKISIKLWKDFVNSYQRRWHRLKAVNPTNSN